MSRHLRKKTTRRSVLKGAAAMGGIRQRRGLCAGGACGPKTIKLGYVSPQTGPLAAFAQADNFVIRSFMETVKSGLKIGGEELSCRGDRSRNSSSDPNRWAAESQED